jgi:glucose/arabinose dehydrogenase
MRKIIFPVILLLVLAMTVIPASSDNQAPMQPAIVNNPAAQQVVQSVTVPPGFEITIWASNVPGARSLEWTPNGTLFVGTRDAGNVYALRDDNSDGVADGVITIASGMWGPNGVAFRNGSLWLAEINRLWRYDDIEANLANPPAPVHVTDFPAEGHHGWKFIRFGPDGRLYVPIGSPCNVCETVDERFGTILSMNADGSDQQIYAQGIRNTVGFDWHPLTGELWFTDNGADNMGDDIPEDELNHAPQTGMHFGFPYCHQGNVPDPDFTSRTCDEFVAPVQLLGPHVAALGMRFYTGTQFPSAYRNQILIAQHGSWNRSVAIGYRVMLVRLDGAGNAVSYESFAEGWLQNGQAWGRPVDVEQLPDGSMLVSDDLASAIYRIRYVGPPEAPAEPAAPAATEEAPG